MQVLKEYVLTKEECELLKTNWSSLLVEEEELDNGKVRCVVKVHPMISWLGEEDWGALWDES